MSLKWSRQAPWTVRRFSSCLLVGEVGPAVHRYRHDVRGAVAEPYPAARQAHLLHLPGEVARRMGHRLVGGGDRAGGGEVVCPEVGGDDPAVPRFDQPANPDEAVVVDDRLRGLHHQLAGHPPYPERTLQLGERRIEHPHLLGVHDLGHGHDEAIWSNPPACSTSVVMKMSSVRSDLR